MRQGDTRRFLSRAGRCALLLILLCFAGWSALALWFQTGGGDILRGAAVAAWLLALVATTWITIRGRQIGRALLVFLVLGFAGWWLSISPRLDRDWAPDVARIVTGSTEGDIVTLNNVRDFGWRNSSDAEERWLQRRYDLSTLTETDVVLSYWGIDAIAHTLISFGFSDGQRVVFSVEIRRERGEEFSSVAGFFKVYELALVAAEERDILYLRTNMRNEDTYLYPLDLPQKAMRQLFLSYIETGNALARSPAFYNTLTANCTTVIFDLARLIAPGIPLDWRILLSGYLPSYLAEQQVLRWQGSEAALRQRAAISRSAREAAPGLSYSEAIRKAD